MTDPTSRAYAEQLDATDALASYRGRFEIPDDSVIYLDGNSLGRLPASTASSAPKGWSPAVRASTASSNARESRSSVFATRRR